MRAKQQSAFDIERVVHGSRRMVLRLVERSEIVPVGFDFWSIGDVESYRPEDRLDALPGANDRMDPSETAAASRERYVERLFPQPGFQGKAFDRFAARLQQGFDLLLGLVDQHACLGALLRRKLAESFEHLCQRATLAEKSRLGLLESGKVPDAVETRFRVGDDAVELVHFVPALTE